MVLRLQCNKLVLRIMVIVFQMFDALSFIELTAVWCCVCTYVIVGC